MTELLTRAKILAASDLTFEIVKVPEWGGEVRVKSMTAADRDQFDAEQLDMKKADDTANIRRFRARLVALTVVDENGARVFEDADVDALGAKSVKALDRVFSVAFRLNSFSNEDVEALTKNSESAPTDASASS